MTISIKPTASGSTIEQDGSTILTVDGSGNISAENNFTATGHVLQVVNATYSTVTGVSSSSYTDSGITASITPSSTSSKILVIVSISGRVYSQQNGDREYYQNIVRGSTQVHQNVLLMQSGTGLNGYALYPIKDMTYLDSPSTTSSTTYKVQFAVNNTANDTAMRINELNGVSTITLMEIAG
jgi:hypothetical protein